VQEVEPRGIPEEDAIAEPLHELDLVGIVIKHRRADAGGEEQPSDDLTEASEPRDALTCSS
jgi:hypothetical protein